MSSEAEILAVTGMLDNKIITLSDGELEVMVDFRCLTWRQRLQAIWLVLIGEELTMTGRRLVRKVIVKSGKADIVSMY